MTYPIPDNEAGRLRALERYDVMDTTPEAEYDDIVFLASQICGTPISLITLLDEDRQWFKANFGLGVAQTSRDVAFCAHAIVQDDVMVVEDATRDNRFQDNPLVLDDPNIRFYAGAPLVTPDGYALGTLCVIDNKPRQLNSEQLRALKALSRQVVSMFELRRAAQHERELQDAMQSILVAAGEGIFGLDHAGVATFVNPAAATMLGYEVEELVTEHLHELTHYSKPDGSPYPLRECPIYASLSNRTARTVIDEVFWRKDGTCFPVEYTVTPLLAEDSVTGSVVIFRDITERNQLDRMKDDLISQVSHELRTPLTSIKGYAEGLLADEDGPLNDEQRRSAETVLRNANRLQSLVDDILTISRLEAGRLKLMKEQHDLETVLTAVLEEFTHAARKKEITLQLNTEGSLVVEVDESRITQVIGNLVANAIKFSDQGGAVEISAHRDADEVSVEVRDHGMGIPAEEISNLFQRFFRASTASRTEGTGLGLVISKELVELHDGRISVASEVGTGSTFTLTLPALPSDSGTSR